jgi:hypothetical protein
MKEQIMEITAYCGLFCRDCLRYRGKIPDAARTLLSEIEKRKFDNYAEVKMIFDKSFDNYAVFIGILRKITELDCEKSCREGKGCSSFECPIVRCCLEQKYEGCWQCHQLTSCDKFDFLKPFHGETPKSNCIHLRDNGFDNFTAKKQAFYIWDDKERAAEKTN